MNSFGRALVKVDTFDFIQEMVSMGIGRDGMDSCSFIYLFFFFFESLYIGMTVLELTV